MTELVPLKINHTTNYDVFQIGDKVKLKDVELTLGGSEIWIIVGFEFDNEYSDEEQVVIVKHAYSPVNPDFTYKFSKNLLEIVNEEDFFNSSKNLSRFENL